MSETNGKSDALTLSLDGEVVAFSRGETDRPPIVVPPTVLVQRPPEAWGEGR